jgi:hypothetical protein
MLNLFKFFWVCLGFYVILIISELILTFSYVGELVDKLPNTSEVK